MRRVDEVRSQSAGDAVAGTRAEVGVSDAQTELLSEIRDILKRIDAKS